MQKRFVSIWFRHLATDWHSIRRPELRQASFVIRALVHGRMLISAANAMAQTNGIDSGMVLADARAIIPNLEVLDDSPGLSGRLLKQLAQDCIRFTPITAIDPPDGILLDVTGCAHLWGSDKDYLTAIIIRLKTAGYGVRAAMADTIGAAWASARFARRSVVIDSGQHMDALLSLPATALRIETDTEELLQKLGLRRIRDFMNMPRPSLRRRFGPHLLLRLDQALGLEEERIIPEQPVVVYQERLPCLEPIITATGIEIALQRLLEGLCGRLQQEQKGLRMASFKGYRVDGKIEEIRIGTNRPSHHAAHLFKLFEIKLSTLEPALGIELFMLEAPKVEELSPAQEKLWEGGGGLEDNRLSELIDRLAVRLGAHTIHRYIPNEQHWPERSLKPASSLHQRSATAWRTDKPRPLQLLAKPEPIEVTAPVPDYPPMLFRYRGKLHKIKKADGPERIEREWWLEEGDHRDYYCVEDEEGHRYWVFRCGHYGEDKTCQWFLYGFFA
ncbi:MAG: DNA polymerase Y family protein [Bacteroidota bacterium]|nr:DNA polymerase Y family protein [Bacteroidota bacterium]MDP4251177.1 DNA polymerase Y family protein [Bacteroidota bacterium]